MPRVRTSNGADRKSVKAIAEVVHRSIMKFTQVERATRPLINAFTLTTPAQAARAAEEEALRTGLSLGMTLIDTAGIYGNGDAERLIPRIR